MRNKIDMFNVKCRKNHTNRIYTSIVFCELTMVMWYELSAQLLIVQSKLYEVERKEEVWRIFQLKMPIKKRKERSEEERQPLMCARRDEDRQRINELNPLNYEVQIVTDMHFLLLQIHKDCIPTGMLNVLTNRSSIRLLYSPICIPCKCSWNVSNVICHRKCALHGVKCSWV